MSWKKLLWINLTLLSLLLGSFPVYAQETPPQGPVYVVQPGDSLWAIAVLFGVPLDDLAAANGITDPGQLAVGERLVIPGLEGIEGVLTTVEIPFGENLSTLARAYGVPQDWLIRLNRLTSPLELYAGGKLIIPLNEDQPEPQGGRVTLRAGQSLLELAVQQGINPWALTQANRLAEPWGLLPGDSLALSEGENRTPGALPDAVAEIALNSLPLVQGRTMMLRLDLPSGTTLRGQFAERPLNFFSLADGQVVALQGVHAMLEPGVYPLSLEGELPDGTPLRFTQGVYVREGGYPYDPPLTVASQTTNTANNETENARWAEIVAPVTPERYWEGMFQSPMPEYLSDCFPSRFGNRRSYNASGYLYFHTGLDFCGQTGVEIYAAASGRVVFTGELIVRGNATVIDHGWGVYSAYAHQSEILVNEGDWVEAGQLIGRVGATGRVTGPHLHWEMIVGGVQVNPMQWLEESFP